MATTLTTNQQRVLDLREALADPDLTADQRVLVERLIVEYEGRDARDGERALANIAKALVDAGREAALWIGRAVQELPVPQAKPGFVREGRYSFIARVDHWDDSRCFRVVDKPRIRVVTTDGQVLWGYWQLHGEYPRIGHWIDMTATVQLSKTGRSAKFLRPSNFTVRN